MMEWVILYDVHTNHFSLFREETLWYFIFLYTFLPPLAVESALLSFANRSTMLLPTLHFKWCLNAKQFILWTDNSIIAHLNHLDRCSITAEHYYSCSFLKLCGNLSFMLFGVGIVNSNTWLLISIKIKWVCILRV